MKVGRHLPAIHRSPTTIIFLRMTLLTTLLEKVRRQIKETWSQTSVSHAQEQFLTPEGWLYSGGKSFGTEETALFSGAV